MVLLISIPFVLWFNGFKQFSDGITDTRISMWILLSGNILNIVGNYILIYGKLGMPELGLVGAGISTLSSRIIMVVAYCRTDGNGNRLIQPQCHYDRLAW